MPARAHTYRHTYTHTSIHAQPHTDTHREKQAHSCERQKLGKSVSSVIRNTGLFPQRTQIDSQHLAPKHLSVLVPGESSPVLDCPGLGHDRHLSHSQHGDKISKNVKETSKPEEINSDKSE